MSSNIVELFYTNGGYESSSEQEGAPAYISIENVTGTYIPQGVLRLNALCDLTVSFDTSSLSTGNVMDDLIVAELALSIADSQYDRLHVDPETGETENKHWDLAYRYMLDMYGVSVDGRMVLPRAGATFQASILGIEIATMSF